MHGLERRPTTTPNRSHRSRVISIVLTTVGLVAASLLAVVGETNLSAGATPTISSLTLPTAGLSPAPVSATYIDTQAISCFSSVRCVATGYYYIQSTTGGRDGFVATGTLNGGSWAWTMSTLPSTGLSPAVATSYPITYPFAISCPSANDCVATGQYIDAANGYDGFVAAGTLSGSTWSWSMMTLSTASLVPGSASPASVNPGGISCPSTSTCVTTGYYLDSATRRHGYVATGSLSAGSWTWSMSTLSTTTLPSGSTASTFVVPVSVDCASTTSCVATGQYHDSLGYTFAFYAPGTLSGSTWSWSMLNLPTIGLSPAANSNTEVVTSSISCGSVTTCLATGQYYDSNGGYVGFVDSATVSGSTWSWSTTTLPLSGLSPASATSAYVTPMAVSCASPTSCVVSGEYSDTSSTYDGFLSVGDLVANTWTFATSTVPTSGLNPASKPASFTDDFTAMISCPSTARCVAVGSYSDTSSHYDAYDTSVVLLPTASAPRITNLPTTEIVGDHFTAMVATDGDGAISLSSSTPSVCSVTGLVVSFQGSGTCVLRAGVGDGSAYAGATGSTQSIMVSAGTTTTTIPIGTHATQSKLTFSSKRVSFGLHAVVTLTTSGGSGSGKVSFKLVRGRCTLNKDQLRARSASACTVVATKAGTSRFKARSTNATTFFFGFSAQSALRIAASSVIAKHPSKIVLRTSGGSGRGAITFEVAGRHCILSRDTLHASSAATCTVTATKAWSGTFLPATSRPVVVRFS